MSKRLIHILAIALIAATAAMTGNAIAQTPAKGTNYVELSPPQPTESSGKIEVIEFFWYGCPHCYALEPLVEYYRALRGEHPDWDEYRAAMVKQGKSLLRITPTRWSTVSTGGFPPELS